MGERDEDLMTMQTADASCPQHILYSLLKLFFAAPTASLPQLIAQCLTPEGYTQDQLDYRGSYLTLLLLESTGVLQSCHSQGGLQHGLSSSSSPSEVLVQSAIVRQHAISQLLSEGLWQWAVFIALQYDDPLVRDSAVRDIILRYTPCPFGWETNKSSEEYYLMTKFSIDMTLLSEATAYRSKYRHNLGQEIYYLNQCRQFQSSLSLICQQLVPLSIQNSTELLVQSLLNEMEEKYFNSYLPSPLLILEAGDRGASLSNSLSHPDFGREVMSEEDECRVHYYLWSQSGGLLLSYFNLCQRYESLSLSVSCLSGGEEEMKGDRGGGPVSPQMEILQEACELFEKFQGNYYGLCGSRGGGGSGADRPMSPETTTVTRGAIYAIGSQLVEIISQLLRDFSMSGEAGSQVEECALKFREVLRSSSEALPIHQADHLKNIRYERTITAAQQATAGPGDDDSMTL
jgi:hypothetical protein